MGGKAELSAGTPSAAHRLAKRPEDDDKFFEKYYDGSKAPATGTEASTEAGRTTSRLSSSQGQPQRSTHRQKRQQPSTVSRVLGGIANAASSLGGREPPPGPPARRRSRLDPSPEGGEVDPAQKARTVLGKYTPCLHVSSCLCTVSMRMPTDQLQTSARCPGKSIPSLYTRHRRLSCPTC